MRIRDETSTYLDHRLFNHTAFGALELRLVLTGTSPNGQDEGWLGADDASDADGIPTATASPTGPDCRHAADAGQNGERRDDAIPHTYVADMMMNGCGGRYRVSSSASTTTVGGGRGSVCVCGAIDIDRPSDRQSSTQMLPRGGGLDQSGPTDRSFVETHCECL